MTTTRVMEIISEVDDYFKSIDCNMEIERISTDGGKVTIFTDDGNIIKSISVDKWLQPPMTHYGFTSIQLPTVTLGIALFTDKIS